MVLSGNFSPDPSNRPDENFMPAGGLNIYSNISGSDSESDEIPYEGYEILPQDFAEMHLEGHTSEESSEDETDMRNIKSHIELSGFDQATKLEVSQLWNTCPADRISDITIDSTKEEQIKNLMAGFKLPSTAIPSWANQIPEEEWKQQIIDKVNLLNKVTPV